MGAKLSTLSSVPTIPLDAYIAALGDCTYTSELSHARFLKTVKARQGDASVVAKVLIKPAMGLDVSANLAVLEQYRKGLQDIPNTLGYTQILDTERATYYVREYAKHNLYDRISTRPFLEDLEKRWLAFQLLCAMADCHQAGLCHGDIKSENILVSDSLWISIVDWAPYKPVFLPATDSADFLFYFNTSQRRSCYVAPERFVHSEDQLSENPNLLPQYDIYSLGCVFAELLAEGTAPVNYADVFKLKDGLFEMDLSGIQNQSFKELVTQMTSLNPEARPSAHECLERFKDILFPEYFWALRTSICKWRRGKHTDLLDIKEIWSDFDNVCTMLEYPLVKCDKITGDFLPATVSFTNFTWQASSSFKVSQSQGEKPVGTILLLPFIVYTLPRIREISWRSRACDLLLVLAEPLPTNYKLDVVLPYILVLMNDRADTVKITALRSIAQLISSVDEFNGINAMVLSEYVLPQIQKACRQASSRVKAAQAYCLAGITKHCVELESHNETSTGYLSPPMMGQILSQTRSLLAEKAYAVRMAILKSFTSICCALGPTQTNDIILSYVITYLNDKNVFVKAQLFAFLAQIGPLLGPTAFEHFVAPVILQCLNCGNDTITKSALDSMEVLIGTGLINSKVQKIALNGAVKFFIHPSQYLRGSCAALFAAAAKTMRTSELYCVMRPIIKPYMSFVVVNMTEASEYIEASKACIPHNVWFTAVSWASSSEKTAFWKSNLSLAEFINEQSNFDYTRSDKGWIERLESVGFARPLFWQLFAYLDYLNAAASQKNPTHPTSHSEELEFNVQHWTASNPLPDQWQPFVSSKGYKPLINSMHSLTLKTLSQDSRDTAPVRVASISLGLGTSAISQNPGQGLKDSSEPAWPSDLLAVQYEPGLQNFDAQSTKTLIFSVKAHRGRVNSVSANCPHTLFLTAAEDKHVHLWESKSVEKGGARPLHSQEFDSPIKSCVFLASEKIFAVGFSTGRISFYKISGGSATKSGIEFKEIVSQQLDDGYAIQLQQVKKTLYMLMSSGTVVILDLQTGQHKFLRNPPHHGPPSAWVIKQDASWLAIGTRHGFINVWDLRFELLVSSFSVDIYSHIASISLHPEFPEKCIFVAGGGDNSNIITAWDIQSKDCLECLVCNWDGKAVPLPKYEVNALTPSIPKSLDDAITGRGSAPQTWTTITPVLGSKQYGLLTGGSDKYLRYWNLRAPQGCYIISGLSQLDSLKARFMARVGSNVRYLFEKLEFTKKIEKVPRPSLLSHQEAASGKNHHSTITGICAVNNSRQLVISVDEVGFVKVFG